MLNLNLISSAPSPPALGFLAFPLLPPSKLSLLYPCISMEPWCHSDILHARMEGLIKHSLLPTRTETLE
jgi:hypothetical protein